MKHATTTILASLALATISHAGPSGKAPVGKGPVPPPPPSCNCFEPGGQFSLYAAGFIGSGNLDDTMGAGMAVDYFFTNHLGVEVDATWGFASSTIHAFTGSFVVRYPIISACLAPYALVGGGIETDGVTQGTAHVGGGIDIRLKNCFGIFADARYTWAEETDDFTLVRAGVRMNF